MEANNCKSVRKKQQIIYEKLCIFRTIANTHYDTNLLDPLLRLTQVDVEHLLCNEIRYVRSSGIGYLEKLKQT